MKISVKVDQSIGGGLCGKYIERYTMDRMQSIVLNEEQYTRGNDIREHFKLIVFSFLRKNDYSVCIASFVFSIANG